INVITERLSLYQELSEIEDQKSLDTYTTKLIDRFGPLPKPASDLIDSIRLKWIAKSLGIERVLYKKQTLIGYFIADSQSDFYQSETFRNLIKESATMPCALREKPSKAGPRLLIRFDEVGDLHKAIQLLSELQSKSL
ncbi:MAG: transcription-repair coupling factor, partial [Bacteroidetes bacterium]|nr:transcription-repair coupling factor [Bacteroidota bacterium]